MGALGSPLRGSLLSRVLCAIGVCVWLTSIAQGQSAVSGSLPDALRAPVRDGRFDVITSIRGLPLGVRDQLTKMFGGSLDIAESAAPFGKADLPSRRMVVAGCSTTFYCFIYYELAGNSRAWRVAFFNWTPDETRFLWGGVAPGGLSTMDDIRKAILSGSIKGQAGPW